MKDLFDAVLKDGYRGAIILFLCICSYKLFRLKSTTDLNSSCCEGFSFRSHTESSGGHITLTDEEVVTVNNNNANNNV